VKWPEERDRIAREWTLRHGGEMPSWNTAGSLAEIVGPDKRITGQQIAELTLAIKAHVGIARQIDQIGLHQEQDCA